MLIKHFLFAATAACVFRLAAGCVLDQNAQVASLGFNPPPIPAASAALPDDSPGNIDDLRTIPQDVSRFAQAIQSPLSADEQALAMRQFRERHFSPWAANQPTFSLSKSIQGMKDLASKTWFGENRVPVDAKRIQAILADASLDQIPSKNQHGIVIAPTFLRALPSAKPWFETADDFPFDQLQYTELKPNEPVRILHESVSGAWLFVQIAFSEGAYVQGWVSADAVRLANPSVRRRLTSSQWVVVVHDFAQLRDERGKAVPQPKIGTFYPIIKEQTDAWLVQMAVPGAGAHALLKPVRISKNDARRFPLPFTAENVTLLGNELLNTAYGWGEVFRDRDCSAITRDFFLPFGIWLPRNSFRQVNLGRNVSLTGLSSADKKKLISEQGVPFRTLIQSKGHIMLYVGLFEDKPVILHSTWAIRFNNRKGQEEKFYIGRTVLTTLEPGAELALSKGTLLSHIDAMLLLPAMNPPSAAMP